MNKYIQYSKVLKQIAVDKGNFKTVVFREFKGDSKLKEAYGILIKAVKNYEKIVEIVESINKKEKKNLIGNNELFCILVIEQFYSKNKKIQGGGQLKKVILENKEFIAKQLNIDENAQTEMIRQDVNIRWIVKNNNNNNSKNKNNGKTKKEDNNNKMVDEKEELKLKNNELIKLGVLDEHIENLYTVKYPDYQQVIKNDASILECTDFVIQSKSSSMPVYLLFKNVIDGQGNHLSKSSRPSANFDVLDCCSAPGNKTMQAAEYLQNRGKVFAFEKNPARFELLSERVLKYGFNNMISCFNDDFLTVDVNKYPDVEYVVADPSCSGTGMLNHIYFDEDQMKLEKETKQNKKENLTFTQRTQDIFNSYPKKMKDRIIGLGQFQLKILNKLATFNKIKGFSYSTCSIHQQENEDVVAQFLAENPTFELVEACPEWKTRGFITEQLPNGNKCIRVNPFEDKSDGFFVALFQKK